MANGAGIGASEDGSGKISAALDASRKELAPLIEFALWDMERRAALGQPRHVMIGDGFHLDASPRILQTEITRGMLSRPEVFGRPVVVVEHADAKLSEQAQATFARLGSNDASAQELARSMRDSIAKAAGGAPALFLAHERELVEVALRGAKVILPDRRDALSVRIALGAADSQLAATSLFVSSRCEAAVAEILGQQLTDQEQATLDANNKSFSTKLFGGPDGIASLVQSDAEVAERIKRDGVLAAPDSTVVLTYGSAHLAKSQDLDEHLKGTHIAVEQVPAASAIIQRLHWDSPRLFNDLPQVVWRGYEEDPKARLLIMDESILKAWHLKQQGIALSDAEAKTRVVAAKAKYLGTFEPLLGVWEMKAGIAEGTAVERERARAFNQPAQPGDDAWRRCAREARDVVGRLRGSVAPAAPREEPAPQNVPDGREAQEVRI